MQAQNSPAANAEAEEVMQALSDLTFEAEGEIVEETIVKDDAIELTSAIDDAVIDDDFLDDLDLHVKRQAAYDAQTATEMPDIEETRLANEAGTKIKVVNARTVTKTPRTASTTTRIEKDLSAIDAKLFQLSSAVEPSDAAAAEQNKVDVLATRPAQVKIAEKFDNLFTSLNSGRKPSTYVMQAFEALEAKGELTSADVVATFKAAGLGDGTAQSQAGQIMVLFNVVGIAKRDGQKLTALKDSMIADRIRALSAASTPTPTAAPVAEEAAE